MTNNFASADHMGLQLAQPGLEVAQPGLEPAPNKDWAWDSEQQSYTPGGYTDTSQANKSKSEKILGLPVKTFWIVLVVLVVILAGGIGGGVGGGLAAQSRAKSSR
jgi:hypothetical protein